MTSSDGDRQGQGAASPAGAPDDLSAPADYVPRAKIPFRVVGIGASAGGVEALRTFFAATPANSGIAYVVIQHLSPEHESMMADILGRCTQMPVRQVEDGLRVEPDHVYVIRPGRTVTLEDGRLRLGEPVEKHGHRRPVDDFFRSLAREQQEDAIVVVLTGTGTNGTAGAQAVKAVGGLCIAQDPETADFPGMPQSLIYSGYADQVLAVGEIPGAVVRYAQHPQLELDPAGRIRATQEFERHRQQLSEIVGIVRARTGHDFAPYKPATVIRRIQRRMGLLGATRLDEYAAQMREKPAEASALANDLMINVTGFFRDAEAWEALRESVVRPLVEQRVQGETIRAWVTACASGEEPYSLAMLIAEEVERAGKVLEVKVFATDTADKSLALARAGVYPTGIEGDLTAERLERFFDKDDHSFRIKSSLREQVVFAPQDLLRDPPFSRVDIVTCRNLLIYLEPEAQRRALSLLHFALREGGYLLLGNAETLGHAEGLFEVVSKRWRIYRRSAAVQPQSLRMPTLASRVPDLRPITRLAPAMISRPSATLLIQAALLEEFGPPTAVVDSNERIVYFHGDAAPFLQHPSGEFTQHLLEMVRVPFRTAVRTALRQAISEKRAVTVETDTQDGSSRLAITAAPLRQSRAPDNFRVSFVWLSANGAPRAGIQFQPQARPAAGQPGNEQQRPDHVMLEEEVSHLRRELLTSLEAFEATNEDLKASNEEITAINEELQSSNEELETGREELQSLNEELATVNGQLQTKVFELEALTNDLDNLLSSTDIAVVFLDTQLRVRRFTPAISDLLQLIAADIGRPLEDLAQKFTDDNLLLDARRVLTDLAPFEAEVSSYSDRYYLRRALPYRTEDRRVAGVVITFVDITARKIAEEAIAGAQTRLQAVIEQLPAAVLMADAVTGVLLLGNRRASDLFNQPFPLPYIGHRWETAYAVFQSFHPDGRRYELQDWPLVRTLASGELVLDEELDFQRDDGERGTISMSAAPVRNAEGEVVAAVAAFWDITGRKRAENALRESEERFRMLVESAHDYAIYMLDPQGRVVSWNRGAERVTGYSEEEIVGRSGEILFTPEDRAAGVPEQELQLASDSGRALDERWNLHKDGTRFWASGTVTLARDTRNALQGFVKIIRDQTDRKAVDARLHHALQSAHYLRARAEGANRAKDEFISTVSHELRTPLNTIRLWSRMLGSGNVQGKDVIEGGKVIDRAALAQQQLIDDLLDVSRMATGHLRLELRDTRLTEAVGGAVEAIRPLADSRQVALGFELGGDIGSVRADPNRVQQVVLNLLANAVKFTPGNGRVHVRLLRVDDTVEIEVSDTGIGIRPDLLPHVFERFRQGDASATRRYAGLGLGLAIAKQIVELHGGTITAESEGEGRGATFTVSLPLPRRDVAVAEAPVIRNSAPTDQLRGIEVLLVEDEMLAREAIARLLEQYGAQVRAVSSAARAREAFEIRRPDVVVADIGMPQEDGYSLVTSLRRIEESQGTPRVPAVAATAFARTEDRQRALAAGFDEHMAKPVDPERVIEVLARLVREAKSRR